jgi:hypothetical protein
MGGGGRAISRPVVSAGHCWVRLARHKSQHALPGEGSGGAAIQANFEVPCTFSAHTHVSDS